MFEPGTRSEDQVLEMALEAGADDVVYEPDSVEISGAVESFKSLSDALQANKIVTSESGLRFVAQNRTELDLEKTSQILRIIEAIDDLDDVQNVYSNIDITEDLAKELEA